MLVQEQLGINQASSLPQFIEKKTQFLPETPPLTYHAAVETTCH